MAAATAAFDTLKSANTLKAAGVPDKQAEAQAVAFAEVMQLDLNDFVTKDDLAAAVKDLRQESKDAEQRANVRIDAVLAKLDTMDARHRGDLALLRWILGLLVTAVVGILVLLFIFRGPF